MRARPSTEGPQKGALTSFATVNPGQRSCLKCHSEERSNEESVGRAGGA